MMNLNDYPWTFDNAIYYYYYYYLPISNQENLISVGHFVVSLPSAAFIYRRVVCQYSFKRTLNKTQYNSTATRPRLKSVNGNSSCEISKLSSLVCALRHLKRVTAFKSALTAYLLCVGTTTRDCLMASSYGETLATSMLYSYYRKKES